MNFYKHHIGDYAQATAHLSFVEDAAYSRMLRKYYAEEAPLPADVAKVARLIGARTRDEKQAVQTILDEFFTLEADGWHNKRADAELAEAKEQEGERDAKKENERERQRIHREERRAVFAELRARGIVPPWDTKMEVLRAMLNQQPVTPPVTVTAGDTSQPVTPPVTCTATANQTPDARHQTPEVQEHPPTPFAAATGDADPIRVNGHANGEPPGRRKRGTGPAEVPMPEGWEPDDPAMEWTRSVLAEQKLPDAWAWKQLDAMRDYARQRPKWRNADWNATWRNWVRKALEMRS